MRFWIVVALGLLVGVLHYCHVALLHENDRFFSHLSNLEREMTFRFEMGFYYSFYKRIVNAESLSTSIHKLTCDNITEYPNKINALGKFNIYPEVMIGSMFWSYQKFLQGLGVAGEECFTVHRGESMPSVKSCIGIGNPILLYLEVVWIFAGMTAFLLFCYGAYFSDSVYGGFFTIMLFFINHSEGTRVQWAPPLRESFAYPSIVLHCLTVTTI